MNHNCFGNWHEIASRQSNSSAGGRSFNASSQGAQYLWSSAQRSYVQRRAGEVLLKDAIEAIIGETVHKLGIIASIVNVEVDPSWVRLDFYKPPAQRFIEMSECQDDKYNGFKRCKRYACLFGEALKTCLDEVVEHGSLNTLDKVVRHFCREDKDEKLLRQEHAANKKRLEETRRAMANARNSNRERLNAKENELQRIRDAYEEKHAYSLLEVKYVDKYEEDRCYLANFSHNITEQNLRQEIDQHNLKLRSENRVHSEIEEYLQEYVTHAEEETKNWVNKCDADEERLGQEILEAKERKYKLELHHLNVREEYQRHSRKINEWLTRRQLIIEEEEGFRLRSKAATTVQAWWRGEMQRRGFHKKKKKTTGAKGKKGKNKKLKLRK